MVYHENIEKIFNDEVREKRKTGSGVFSKRGKGVKHGISGAFRTPYYFMKTKERKKLNGEVSVSNMYETILTKEEFLLKDKDTQKHMLTRWREIYPNGKIMNEMGIGNAQAFANIVNGLEIPKKPKGGSKPRKAKAQSVAATPTPSQLTFEEPRKVEPILITKGLHLEYNGEYDAEQLSRIFTKLQLLTEGETNKFNLAISITERT